MEIKYTGMRIIIMILLLGAVVLGSCKKNDDPANDPPAAPVINEPLHVYGDYFYINWTGVVGAETYVADVATDQAFANILPDYQNKEVPVKGMFLVEGVNPGSQYFVRMRAVNAHGTSPNSSAREVQTRQRNVLPNMDVEEWITYPNYENPYPEGIWASANKVVDLNPDIYPVLLFKSDEAYSGNYAAKMVTNEAVGMPLLTGSMSTGVFTVNLQNPLKSMISGVPYKSRPARFQGYYKYMGVDGDSCEIRTTLTRWDASAKQKEKIGEAVFRTTDLIEDYTFFDLEIVYFSTANPDTIDVVFAASAGGEYFVGGVGSTLYIDDFDLIFE